MSSAADYTKVLETGKKMGREAERIMLVKWLDSERSVLTGRINEARDKKDHALAALLTGLSGVYEALAMRIERGEHVPEIGS